MNTTGLQRIDRWLGLPICTALTLIRATLRNAPPDCSKPPRNLLVVKLAEQGSTVLAYPALRRAVDVVGRDNVYFAAFEENRFILDALDVIPESNVVTISTGSLPILAASTITAVQRLRALNLDAAIDMEFFSRGSAILTALSGARRRAGYHAFFGGGPNRGDLMTHRLNYNPHLHTTDAFSTLVEAVFHSPADLPAMNFAPPRSTGELPAFLPSAVETAQVRELLQREAAGFRSWILLNPNAGDLLPLRRWPTGRYVELANRLLAQFPDKVVVFTGSGSESPATEDLAGQVGSPRCVSMAGKTTLRQLLVLYTLADVLVTNDSGPAHFAALTPIDVVTLFGPETPALFGARSMRNKSLWAGIPCSPCVNAYNNRQSACRDNLCMQAIQVDDVFAAVCAAYHRRQSRETQ